MLGYKLDLINSNDNANQDNNSSVDSDIKSVPEKTWWSDNSQSSITNYTIRNDTRVHAKFFKLKTIVDFMIAETSISEHLIET